MAHTTRRARLKYWGKEALWARKATNLLVRRLSKKASLEALAYQYAPEALESLNYPVYKGTEGWLTH